MHCFKKSSQRAYEVVLCPNHKSRKSCHHSTLGSLVPEFTFSNQLANFLLTHVCTWELVNAQTTFRRKLRNEGTWREGRFFTACPDCYFLKVRQRKRVET